MPEATDTALDPTRPNLTHRHFCLTSKIFFKLENLPFGKVPGFF